MPYEFRAEDWLTTAQAAELLGLSAGSLRARRSEGRERLPHIRVGNTVLYQRAPVERAAERGAGQ
ncbi:helix-turn-helix domain-containing protein [Streptomyces coerulescens]|uniref:Helix-turn-helix domain-containing protein n=1 Tax=Streptomyces coerulescens TaxID=29304 RepID=A0ABW0CLS6_STRCD